MCGQSDSDWRSLKDIDYDNTVLLGHFHFHFSRVDFLLCEDDTALQNSTADQRNKTSSQLQYCTKFDQLILRKIIKLVATRCHILRNRYEQSMSEKLSFYSGSAQLVMIDSVWPSNRLTVGHTLVSCQNDSSYDHVVFTGGQPHD